MLDKTVASLVGIQKDVINSVLPDFPFTLTGEWSYDKTPGHSIYEENLKKVRILMNFNLSFIRLSRSIILQHPPPLIYDILSSDQVNFRKGKL